jgi:hypothetical protein
MRKGVAALGAGVLGSTLLLAQAGAAPELGTLEREGSRAGIFDGGSEPVEEGVVARAGDEAALIRLEDGSVMRLDPNSALRIESAARPVLVRVLSGRVSLIGPQGRVLTAGAASRFFLPQPPEDADQARRRLQEAATARGSR